MRKQSLERADKNLKSRNGITYLVGKDGKKTYGQTIGRELKKRGYDPKTGEKLREAAEYILSVLDEMD